MKSVPKHRQTGVTVGFIKVYKYLYIFINDWPLYICRSHDGVDDIHLHRVSVLDSDKIYTEPAMDGDSDQSAR